MKLGSYEAAVGGSSVDSIDSCVTVDSTGAPQTARPVSIPARSVARTSDVPQRSVRSRRGGFRGVLAVLDVLAALVAGLAVLAVAAGGPVAVQLVDVLFCAAVVAVWAPFVALNGGYERGFVGVGNREFSRVFRAFLQATAVTVFAAYVLNVEPSRSVVVPMLALLLVLTCVERFAARKVLHLRRGRGLALAPVLAVGDADAVVEFASQLRRDRFVGLQVVAACYSTPAVPGTAVAAELRDLGVRDLGCVDDIGAAARTLVKPTVAVVGSTIGAERLKRIAWDLEGADADLVVAPGLAELGGRRMRVRPVAGLPLLHIEQPRFTGPARVAKGAFDKATAAVALLLLSPLLLGIGLVVRATSSGPAFFRQTRVGRNGREFTMWKFRSMSVDAEIRLADLTATDDGNGMLFKMRSDPRVTPVGRFLRRLSLDELPQLINVLTGSMSLVGPRPPLPSEVARYHDDAHRRLLVKPGLTGLWQISGRSDLSWEESIRLDLRYVEDWSLSMDLIVLWKTARAVARAEGAY